MQPLFIFAYLRLPSETWSKNEGTTCVVTNVYVSVWDSAYLRAVGTTLTSFQTG